MGPDVHSKSSQGLRGGVLHKHNLEFNGAYEHFIHILSSLCSFCLLFCFSDNCPVKTISPTPDYICPWWYRTKNVMVVKWLHWVAGA